MVGNEPNFGLFFRHLFRLNYNTTEEKDVMFQKGEKLHCLLTSDRIARVSWSKVLIYIGRQRLLFTYIFLYLPDRNVSRKCTLCHCQFDLQNFYRSVSSLSVRLTSLLAISCIRCSLELVVSRCRFLSFFWRNRSQKQHSCHQALI